MKNFTEKQKIELELEMIGAWWEMNIKDVNSRTPQERGYVVRKALRLQKKMDKFLIQEVNDFINKKNIEHGNENLPIQ